MRKLVDCEHCGGRKMCTKGGRSCKHCLAAAGRPANQWAVVRCSYCGGQGKVWVEEEPEQEQAEPETEEAAPQEEAPEGEPAGPKPKRKLVTAKKPQRKRTRGK